MAYRVPEVLAIDVGLGQAPPLLPVVDVLAARDECLRAAADQRAANYSRGGDRNGEVGGGDGSRLGEPRPAPLGETAGAMDHNHHRGDDLPFRDPPGREPGELGEGTKRARRGRERFAFT